MSAAEITVLSGDGTAQAGAPGRPLSEITSSAAPLLGTLAGYRGG